MVAPAALQGLDKVLAMQQVALASRKEDIRALQVQQQAVLVQQGEQVDQVHSLGECLLNGQTVFAI